MVLLETSFRPRFSGDAGRRSVGGLVQIGRYTLISIVCTLISIALFLVETSFRPRFFVLLAGARLAELQKTEGMGQGM